MKNISLIKLTGCKAEKQRVRNLLAAVHYNVDEVVRRNLKYLSCLNTTSLHLLDEKIKSSGGLSFEEAFRGNCYTLAATNRFFYGALRKALAKAARGKFTTMHAIASGTAFMQLMAVKESLGLLSAEEIAGLAAAALMDRVILFSLGEEITETCGMGGDRGFELNGETKMKSINVSTLSAIVLSSLGVPTVKHGSYSNTSALGSTEVIESFGANVDTDSVEKVQNVWRRTGFAFFDAHWCKTIHDLSHLLRIETVNHIIGPMTPPISGGTRINKFMGVNEKVHPSTIVKAYNILHERGFQKMGGIVVVTGLDVHGESIDNPNDTDSVKKTSVLDEVSPFVSVVSVGWAGTFLGTDMLRPRDFGLTISLSDILVEKAPGKIQKSNHDALTGKNPALADYLAMNSVLALFATRYTNRADAMVRGKVNRVYLKECFNMCRATIHSGKPKRKLLEYVRETGGTFSSP